MGVSSSTASETCTNALVASVSGGTNGAVLAVTSPAGGTVAAAGTDVNAHAVADLSVTCSVALPGTIGDLSDATTTITLTVG